MNIKKIQSINNNSLNIRFTKPGTIWSAAKGGTVQQFESAVKKGQDVYKFGEHYHETVLHVACLFSNTPVALHIARNYPKLIPQQYGWIYKGIISLHFLLFFFSNLSKQQPKKGKLLFILLL